MGNIRNKKIIDIWDSKKLKDIRQYKNLGEVCRGCYHLRKCKGGLTGMEYLKKQQAL